MNLVLRDYLALQKESGELDVLIPDLLLNMGLRPLNRAGKGSRQYGVDVPAVGTDPRDGVRKLVLVTVKQGDIDRRTWNGGLPADVRPSLDEILDTYLRSHVEPSHQGLPVRVIVATGGDMDEQVRLDWASYTENNGGTVQRGVTDYEVSFEFWGGHELAGLIESHLLDEYLFPSAAEGPDVRTVMRRTLALAGDPNFDLGPYEALVRATLDPVRLDTASKRRRALRALRLTLRVIYRWGEREGNLRPALLASEYVLLRVWHFMVTQGLTGANRVERPELGALYGTWHEVLYAYLEAIRPHCETPHGLFGYSPVDDIEYPVRVFDVLGHLALAGLGEFHMAKATYAKINQLAESERDGVEGDAREADPDGTDADGTGDDTPTGPDAVDSEGPASEEDAPDKADEGQGLEETASDETDQDAGEALLEQFQGYVRNTEVIANRIVAVIVHNPAASTPPFDENVVEVALALRALALGSRADDAREWAKQIVQTLGFAWTHKPSRVPTYAGTYEDRVDMLLGVEEPEFPSSTILALLAEWAVVTDDSALYDSIRDVVQGQLSEVDLQVWVPTDETDPDLYAGPATNTGLFRTSIRLPTTFGEFVAQVHRESSFDEDVADYSADLAGLPLLSLIASRQFRTPTRPSMWRALALSRPGRKEDTP